MPTVASGSMIASPLEGWSRPAMIFSSVDLPVPFGPTTPILAPCRNDSVTLSRTTLSPWALRTLRSVKTYSAMIFPAYGADGSAPQSPAAPVGPVRTGSDQQQGVVAEASCSDLVVDRR